VIELHHKITQNTNLFSYGSESHSVFGFCHEVFAQGAEYVLPVKANEKQVELTHAALL